MHASQTEFDPRNLHLPEPELMHSGHLSCPGCGAALGMRLALITAGPTQEPLDPVRYISNRSSGKMGYALAEVAAERGARVVRVRARSISRRHAAFERGSRSHRGRNARAGDRES